MGSIKGLTWREAYDHLKHGSYYARPEGSSDWLMYVDRPTLAPAGATLHIEPKDIPWEAICREDAFPIPKAAFFSEVEVADLRRENAEMKAKLYKLGDDILSYGGSDE